VPPMTTIFMGVLLSGAPVAPPTDKTGQPPDL
jgi:hypothetical protein